MPIIEAVSSGAIDYDANSYVSASYADGYFGKGLRGRFWREQEKADREDALIDATQAIEHLLRGQDYDKYDQTRTATRPRGQPLQFPRGVDTVAGSLVVPPDIKDAQCLLALHFLREYLGEGPVVDADAMQAQGITSSSTDGVSATRNAVNPVTWPMEVQRLVMPFWDRAAQTTEAPFGVQPEPFNQWVTPTA